MTHRFALRVYYEDTDLAGIVYYANYLKFIERGRTEYVRERGLDQTALKREAGIVFAVRHLECDFFAPARFEDDLVVETEVEAVKGASLVMRQRVVRGEEVLFSARVTLVAVTEAGAPTRLPADIRHLLG